MLALPLRRLTPLPRLSTISDCALARLGALQGGAVAIALPGPPCRIPRSPGKGNVVPARGLLGHVPGLGGRGLMDVCALVGSLHSLPLPACGPGRGLRTVPGAVGFAGGLDEGTVSGAGSLPGPAALEPVAASSACSSARVSAPGVGSPAGGASAAGSSVHLGRFRESPCSERRRRRSSSWERSQSGKKRHGGRSPSPATSSCLARSSASSSSPSSVAGERESVMPPSPGRRGAGGGHSGHDRSGSGRDRSPRPGPSGLDLGSGSLPVAEPSRPEYGVVVALPPVLRVRGMTTALVPSIPSVWIGMTPLGLFFASFESSTVWRNRQV